MPLYTYICSECGYALEELQKFNDAPLTLCPSCGQSSLKKQVSQISIKPKWVTMLDTHGKNPPGTATHSTSKSSELPSQSSPAHSHDHSHGHAGHSCALHKYGSHE